MAVYEHDMAGSPEPLSFSSMFPERPIKPLPKRKLRERLSPEAAESIEYPPLAQQTSIFYPAYSTDHVDEENRRDGTSTGPNAAEAKALSSVRRPMPPAASLPNGVTRDKDGDGPARSASIARSPAEILNRTGGKQAPKGSGTPRYVKIPTLWPEDLNPSYDSFENTNNKKKRKIPTPGDSCFLTGGHPVIGDYGNPAVGPESASMQNGSGGSSVGGANGAFANNKGISGAGRGTFGRSRNGRSPLRSLSNAANWTERTSKHRPTSQWAAPSSENSVGGIISTAIAKAEKTTTQQGQENVSLLHQHSAKAAPASTQFTFTCESQVPGTQWPGTDPGLNHIPPPIYAPGHGLKQQPPMANSRAGGARSNAAGLGGDTPQEDAQLAAVRARKARKKIDRELAQQERERRKRAEEERRKGSRTGDEWVCDFCLYERIFGEEPKALIRSFEEKVLKERREEEEKRQRLERAKAKSRKGKKTAKAGGKAGHSSKQTQDQGGNGEGISDEEDGTSEDYVDESPSPLDDAGSSHHNRDPEAAGPTLQPQEPQPQERPHLEEDQIA